MTALAEALEIGKAEKQRLVPVVILDVVSNRARLVTAGLEWISAQGMFPKAGGR